jgi:hypothetical protein
LADNPGTPGTSAQDLEPEECPGCRGITTKAVAISVTRRMVSVPVTTEARKLDAVGAPELLARLVELVHEQRGRRGVRQVDLVLEFDGPEWIGVRVPQPDDVVRRRRRDLTAVRRRA